MKIALIGPGIMQIPPPGWGAVEILIWDYFNELTKLGHDVTIINTPNTMNIIQTVNTSKFDFVHLHYDVFYPILEHLKCPKIAITSHYPYIDQIEKHRSDGYSRIFHFLNSQNKYYNFVLADKDVNTFIKCGSNREYIKKISNGIDSKLFQFKEQPILNRTIYLGKITSRKNQSKYQTIDGIDFIGNNHDSAFDIKNANYLGEWTRELIHNQLTNYSNLLLLSDGEADPLVVKEALIAGLGVVVNRTSSANLDNHLSFITIIDDDKINDLTYIQTKIDENKKASIGKRIEIRQYGIGKFDISIEVNKYINTVNHI
jgi:hypothetical protein